MSATRECVDCHQPTTARHRLCPGCTTKRAHTSATEQGLPAVIDDEPTYQRLAVLLDPTTSSPARHPAA